MNIAILGYGVVGKSVELLCEENNINVSYILMRNQNKVIKPNMTASVDDILNDKDVDCVVECMGGIEPSYTYVSMAIKNGKHVVSSNKKMLADKLIELADLAIENKVSLLFSSACGGGIPWIKNLAEIKKNDSIIGFKGIMNGTSNYILDMMTTNNCSFDEALKKAQGLGYAEADPSDDIDGIDTANKVILSAAIAFDYKFQLDDMYIKGIRYISEKELTYCNKNNLSCVLLGKGIKNNDETYTLSVIPTFVKKEKVLGNIHLNNNCFILNSKNLNELTFIGQGAGGIPTASNVIRDINSLTSPYVLALKGTSTNTIDISKNHYYIRTSSVIPSDYIEDKIDENIYISKPIDLKTLKEIIKDDEIVFIAEVEND